MMFLAPSLFLLWNAVAGFTSAEVETLPELEGILSTGSLLAADANIPTAQDVHKWISVQASSLHLSWNERFSIAINRAVTAYAVSLAHAPTGEKIATSILYETSYLHHQISGLESGAEYTGVLEALVGPHLWAYKLLNFTMITPVVLDGPEASAFRHNLTRSDISDLERVRMEVRLRWSFVPFKTDGIGPSRYILTVWNDQKVVKRDTFLPPTTAQRSSSKENNFMEIDIGGLPLDHLYKVTIEGQDRGGVTKMTLNFNLLTGSMTAGEGVFTTGGVDGCFSALQVRCPNSDRCVSPYWICDGSKDCPDGADEDACNAKGPCKHGFTCWGSNQCLPASWKCDGFEDCKDGEDELGCGNCGGDDLLRCGTGSDCVSVGYACDGQRQCPDGWDETDAVCNYITEKIETQELLYNFQCPEGQVSCGLNGGCVALASVCNGISECIGGEDEMPLFCAMFRNNLFHPKNITPIEETFPSYLLAPEYFHEASTVPTTTTTTAFTTTPPPPPPPTTTTTTTAAVEHLSPSAQNKFSSIPVNFLESKLSENHHTTEINTQSNMKSTSASTTTYPPAVTPTKTAKTTTATTSTPSISTTFASSLIFEPFPETTSQCRDDEFDCGDGWCVPIFWLCDGRFDCLNGEDEEEKTCRAVIEGTQSNSEKEAIVTNSLLETSKSSTCPKDHLMCSTGKCVERSRLCDGVNDCPEKEDEKTCEILIITSNHDEAFEGKQISSPMDSFNPVDKTPQLTFLEANDLAEGFYSPETTLRTTTPSNKMEKLKFHDYISGGNLNFATEATQSLLEANTPSQGSKWSSTPETSEQQILTQTTLSSRPEITERTVFEDSDIDKHELKESTHTNTASQEDHLDLEQITATAVAEPRYSEEQFIGITSMYDPRDNATKSNEAKNFKNRLSETFLNESLDNQSLSMGSDNMVKSSSTNSTLISSYFDDNNTSTINISFDQTLFMSTIEAFQSYLSNDVGNDTENGDSSFSRPSNNYSVSEGGSNDLLVKSILLNGDVRKANFSLTEEINIFPKDYLLNGSFTMAPNISDSLLRESLLEGTRIKYGEKNDNLSDMMPHINYAQHKNPFLTIEDINVTKDISGNYNENSTYTNTVISPNKISFHFYPNISSSDPPLDGYSTGNTTKIHLEPSVDVNYDNDSASYDNFYPSNNSKLELVNNSPESRVPSSNATNESSIETQHVNSEKKDASNVTFTITGVTSDDGFLVLSTTANKNVSTGDSTILIAVHARVTNGTIPKFVIHSEVGQRYDYQVVQIVQKPLQSLNGSVHKKISRDHFHLEKIITFRLENNGKLKFGSNFLNSNSQGSRNTLKELQNSRAETVFTEASEKSNTSCTNESTSITSLETAETSTAPTLAQKAEDTPRITIANTTTTTITTTATTTTSSSSSSHAVNLEIDPENYTDEYEDPDSHIEPEAISESDYSPNTIFDYPDEWLGRETNFNDKRYSAVVSNNLANGRQNPTTTETAESKINEDEAYGDNEFDSVRFKKNEHLFNMDYDMENDLTHVGDFVDSNHIEPALEDRATHDFMRTAKVLESSSVQISFQKLCLLPILLNILFCFVDTL